MAYSFTLRCTFFSYPLFHLPSSGSCAPNWSLLTSVFGTFLMITQVSLWTQKVRWEAPWLRDLWQRNKCVPLFPSLPYLPHSHCQGHLWALSVSTHLSTPVCPLACEQLHTSMQGPPVSPAPNPVDVRIRTLNYLAKTVQAPKSSMRWHLTPLTINVSPRSAIWKHLRAAEIFCSSICSPSM